MNRPLNFGHLHIDGTMPDNTLQSGEGKAPYYVFDSQQQKNVAGPYPVKWMAKLWIALEKWSLS